MHYRQTGPGRAAATRLAVALAFWALADGAHGTLLAQQVPESRAAVTITESYRPTSSSFTQSVDFETYSETGSLTATYTSGRGPVTAVDGMVRLWRSLGVGASGSFYRDSTPASVSASVPSPFAFGQPRQISGQADVIHEEVVLHLQAVWWFQPGRRVEITVSAGPSVFRVDQDFVSDVTYQESFPYDTATYTGASVLRMRKTELGGNVGADAGWLVGRHLSVVGGARYSHASATFDQTSAAAVPLGGIDVGGGLRFRF